MLETLIVILLIVWLVGFGWGRRRVRRSGRWRGGNLIHLLLVIVLILLVIRVLG